MLINYFKVAIRNIRRFASYTTINVLGLTLGIACVTLIYSLVTYHFGFDNFHANSDRIYRFVTEQHRDQVSYVASVPPAFGNAFKHDYSFGEKVARVCTLTDQMISFEHNGETKKFSEQVAFADQEFFEIFNFPVAEGQPKNFIRDKNTAAITGRIAKKYFGNESALGKTIRFSNTVECKVTAVLKDIPETTDLRSEIYLSYSDVDKYNDWILADDSWGGITTELFTFVLLNKGVAPRDVESVLPAYVKKYRAESKNVHHYKLQPLRDMHFNPDYGGSMSKTMLWVLSTIGFFLIFTACLNFINLATAQAFNRSREIGVRKILGSARMQLFWQFTCETGVIVVMALAFAFCIAYALLPMVNELFDSRITPSTFLDLRFVLFALALVILVTFMAGAYPGIVLSGFRPVLALKAKFSDRTSGNFNLRRILIVTQFTISQVLLIGLLVITYQMQYFRSADLGFDRENVVMIPGGSQDKKLNSVKERFMRIPHVLNVSLCFAAPASDIWWGTSFFYDNRTEMEAFGVSFKGADENYLETFNIQLVAGRNLTPSDTAREFLVNEVLVQKLGLTPEEILGKPLGVNGNTYYGPVVGVVSDFHDHSLRSSINPVVITTQLDTYNGLAVKIDMADASTTLAALEQEWNQIYPDQLYQYEFLDDQTAKFYQKEETILQLVQVFTFIALFIGCMGLYGLVSFMAVRKTKEIGIRKVLGGSISHILWIFGKEFVLLLIIAFALATPAGWWMTTKWLENYVYRVDLTAGIFIMEVCIISILVMFTVGVKSAKAAMMNPVDSLRTE
jgi:putative ABC transport system permease protein